MEATIVKEKRYCPECGKEIIGRSDKTFCSSPCRNNYNNSVNKDRTNLMRNINNALRRNYKILQDLNVGVRVTATKKVLRKKKFDFSVYTSVLNAKNGNMYYVVYDLVYQELDDDVFLIFKSDF